MGTTNQKHGNTQIQVKATGIQPVAFILSTTITNVIHCRIMSLMLRYVLV